MQSKAIEDLSEAENVTTLNDGIPINVSNDGAVGAVGSSGREKSMSWGKVEVSPGMGAQSQC